MGFVSVFLDTDGEFLIFPLAGTSTTLRGPLREFERLSANTASVAGLGEAVLRCLTVSEQREGLGIPYDEKPRFFEVSSKAKSFREFCKTRQQVMMRKPPNATNLNVQFWPKKTSLSFVGPGDDALRLSGMSSCRLMLRR